ncbi:MAG: MT-A70 family methyltransferase [Methylovulum sp.]
MILDKDFKSYLLPLNVNELSILEDSLLEHGCRDALVTWNGVLIDGHNRFELCQKHNIAFNTTEIYFQDREAAIDWIESNQLGRRNLTPDQFKLLLGRKYNRIKLKKSGFEDRDLSVAQNEPRQSTAEKLAEQHGVSRETVKRAGALADALDNHAVPELIQKVEQGSVSVSAAADIAELPFTEQSEIVARGEREILLAAKDIRAKKAEARAQERIVKIADIAKGNTELNIAQTYPVIYADPPWRYEHSISDSRQIENHYPTMSLDEICALPVESIATKDCILFMWATSPKLAESIDVIKAWGFEYKTCAVWDKQKIGMGYYFRQQHELLLVATRGAIPPPPVEARVSSVVSEGRAEHSAKPECFYEIIEAMYPDLPKIELFCRSPRENWSVWGNQSNVA